MWEDKLFPSAFQSTRPSRASTVLSAHNCLFLLYFNPQGPRGPRRGRGQHRPRTDTFQSTRPSRASTFPIRIPDTHSQISIHKALAGLDALSIFAFSPIFTFQSTRPSRASTISISLPPLAAIFQSTRPSRASTSPSTI